MSKFGIDFAVAPWMQYAEAELRVAEVAGSTDNQRILEYLATTTYGGTLHDEVPWCSAFVNWCLKQAGLTGTNSAAASSWMHWGQMLPEPRLGCLASCNARPRATPRPLMWASGWGARPGPGQLNLLGGNQHDSVRLSVFPLEQVKDFRWPA